MERHDGSGGVSPRPVGAGEQSGRGDVKGHPCASPLGAERTIPRHWVRTVKGEWSPRRVAFLDCETRWSEIASGRRHELRCWAAELYVRDPVDLGKRTRTSTFATSNEAFVEWVESQTTTRDPLWIYAHNLGFDAQILDIPECFTDRGWQVTGWHVTDGPVWWRLRKGRHRVVLTCSTSVFPAPLDVIAEDLGVGKEPLPPNECDDADRWRARVETDVRVLADAVLTCLDWWDANKLGRWRLTGPSSGWNAYRRRYLDTPVLVEPDPTLCGYERGAGYGGRREAYRIGAWRDYRFTDIDFRAAYPSVVASNDVPVRRLGPLEGMTAEEHSRRPVTLGVIADCVVTTKTPVVPVRYGQSIFYPVGTFKTRLCSPEIDRVLELGGTVELVGGWRYQLGPAMRTWGRWIKSVLDAPAEDVPAVVRRMVKHWSRAVIGRWTMRTTRRVPLQEWPVNGNTVDRARWIEYGDADTMMVDGVKTYRAGAIPTRRVEGWTVLEQSTWTALIADQEHPDGFPAVWVWVESLCRVALDQAMREAPDGAVWQCDTDGFILGQPGRTERQARAAGRGSREAPRATRPADLADTLPATLGGLGWAVKGRYTSLRLIGPQHLWVDRLRRLAGISRDAEEVTPGVFRSLQWPGYMSRLRSARTDGYVQRWAEQKLRAGINPRWVASDGRTFPVEFYRSQGSNRIAPPRRYDGARHRITWAMDQHHALTRVMLLGSKLA